MRDAEVDEVEAHQPPVESGGHREKKRWWESQSLPRTAKLSR